MRNEVLVSATAALKLFLVPFCRLFDPWGVPGAPFAAPRGRLGTAFGPSWLENVFFYDSMAKTIDFGGSVGGRRGVRGSP